MRIGLVSTLATRVREHGSGSIEGLVWLLARELTVLGHDVTVFAAAGSETSGEVVATLPGPYAEDGSPDDWQLCEWINLSRAVAESARFDVLHTHAYLWGLPLEPLSRAPMVHTLHVMPSEDQARLWAKTRGACVTAISAYQWHEYPALNPAALIHHGVDPAAFTFRESPDDYVCFLGRFTPGKGVLRAITAARASGIRLLLAGPPNAYYRERVAPLVDGHEVEFVGSVGGHDRETLLGGARALLYPISEPEPFGLVLIEAMMCGTPVVAIRIGAVPEIVDEGITGFTAGSLEEFGGLIVRSAELDRRLVRMSAEVRFAASRMATSYAHIYGRRIDDWACREGPAPHLARLSGARL